MNASEQRHLYWLSDRAPQTAAAVALGVLVLLGWLFNRQAEDSAS